MKCAHTFVFPGGLSEITFVNFFDELTTSHSETNSFLLFVSPSRFGVGDRCNHSDGSPSWSSHSGPAGHRDPGSARLRRRSVI